MFKSIALYGKRQIKEASRAFDRALQFATGDTTTHLLLLVKVGYIFLTCSVLHYDLQAIATFNAHEYDEAIMYVKDMAEASFNHGADLLLCNIVLVSINSGSWSEFEIDSCFAHQTYFYAEMALAASENNIREKAIEYITTALKIATTGSLEKIDLSIYTEFDVVR